MLVVRDASEADLPAILAIYNHAIETTTAVFSYAPHTMEMRREWFADKIAKINFKPIIKGATTPKGIIPLTVVSGDGKPLNGTCMTAAGTGVATASGACDSCHFLDDKMAFLREETTKRGFKTVDGVHMGPCEIHKTHAHTIGPEGSLYACPGFAGNVPEAIGHIDGRSDGLRRAAAARFAKIAAWEECDDCAFIPVCAGGCSAAAHTELGDMNKPNCHKPSFEAGVIALARRAAEELHAVPA